MSQSESETEPETETDDDPDVPEIEADEQADFGDSLGDVDPAEIEAETSPDPVDVDGDDPEGEEIESSDSDADDDADDGEETDRIQSWGEAYAVGATSACNMVIEEYGGPDAQKLDPEIAKGAPFYLDSAVNEWVETQGTGEQMTPGQAVVVGTLFLAGAAVAQNPAVVQAITDELTEKSD